MDHPVEEGEEEGPTEEVRDVAEVGGGEGYVGGVVSFRGERAGEPVRAHP